MGCQHCVESVRNALQRLGVDVHGVDIGHAEISYGPSLDRKRIDAAISEAGYQLVDHEQVA